MAAAAAGDSSFATIGAVALLANLSWCYSDVAVLLQCCYSVATIGAVALLANLLWC
jgi:hypothetical protein